MRMWISAHGKYLSQLFVKARLFCLFQVYGQVTEAINDGARGGCNYAWLLFALSTMSSSSSTRTRRSFTTISTTTRLGEVAGRMVPVYPLNGPKLTVTSVLLLIVPANTISLQ